MVKALRQHLAHIPAFGAHRCTSCAEGDEQYCENGATLTYNSDETNVAGVKTRGGYADHVVVDQKCVHAPQTLSRALGHLPSPDLNISQPFSISLTLTIKV